MENELAITRYAVALPLVDVQRISGLGNVEERLFSVWERRQRIETRKERCRNCFVRVMRWGARKMSSHHRFLQSRLGREAMAIERHVRPQFQAVLDQLEQCGIAASIRKAENAFAQLPAYIQERIRPGCSS
jgi:hypothetical protein